MPNRVFIDTNILLYAISSYTEDMQGGQMIDSLRIVNPFR